MRNVAQWNPQYYQYVLATDPIAYWMEDEKQGNVAYDMVTARDTGARNGAYTGVTLYQPGIGDGRTSPYYDGINDRTNIFSLSFSGIFNGSEGSFSTFFRVAAWDLTQRNLLRLVVDGNNLLELIKRNVANRMDFTRIAGGITQTRSVVGLTSKNWMYATVTWSETANQYIVYLDAVQQGAILPANAWAVGPLNAGQTNLGALAAGAQVFEGRIAHAAVWDRALSPEEIANLYNEAASIPLYAPTSYAEKVIGVEPANLIGYWPQWERAGAVSYDQSGNGRDGAYTGVTLGQPGIGDGETSPFFDGANDYDDVFTAGLQGAFDGAEGTMMCWAKVLNAGVWTDAAIRYINLFFVDANNSVAILKHSNNNEIRLQREGGGTVSRVTVTPYSPTDWFSFGFTWSESSGGTGEAKAFLDGQQQGATLVNLGAWVGNLAATRTLIGQGGTTGAVAFVWNGWIAHFAVWDTALTPAQILYIYEQGVF